MKVFLWLVAFIAFGVLFLALIRYIEKHSIFFPMKGIAATPEEVGIPYEDIYFNTSDNKRLNGWFIPAEGARHTVMFCHGNAGNISHRMEKIVMFREIGVNTFIFDYRGYGNSKGAPSEQGLCKDADAAYEYLTEVRGVPGEDIVLYGESIGGAVVIDLARKVNVGALITEEAFSSIKDMARIAYPFVPHFVFSSRFDSVSKIKNITCPKLIIHSIDDEIVPFHLGEKLFEAAAPPKKFLKIRGGHNTAFFDSEEKFKEGIRAFLQEL